MALLNYYFIEFASHNGHLQQLIHQFASDRVTAFLTHRQLEKAGKQLSAVQMQRQALARR